MPHNTEAGVPFNFGVITCRKMSGRDPNLEAGESTAALLIRRQLLQKQSVGGGQVLEGHANHQLGSKLAVQQLRLGQLLKHRRVPSHIKITIEYLMLFHMT